MAYEQKLTRRTASRLDDETEKCIDYMCTCARGIWNRLRYERNSWEKLGLIAMPDAVRQKESHRNDVECTMLCPSTYSELCDRIDIAYRSYMTAVGHGSVENAGRPRYQEDRLPIVFFGRDFRISGENLYLEMSPQCRSEVFTRFGVKKSCLIITNRCFTELGKISRVTIYPPERGKSRMLLLFGKPKEEMKMSNGRYLSLDLGLCNLFAGYENVTGHSFILGKEYLGILSYWEKRIDAASGAYYQEMNRQGVKYPRPSEKILEMYQREGDQITDLLHRCTKRIVDICIRFRINTVIMGDLKGMPKENRSSHQTNRHLHSLPFDRIARMLDYKLKMKGIRLVRIDESYSSSVSPLCPVVCRDSSDPGMRVERGLFRDGNLIWNADAVGAYNIMRLYMQQRGESTERLRYRYLSSPQNIHMRN